MSDEEYTREELEGMTVQELKDLCIDNELPTEGRKAQLVDRLLGEEDEDADDEPQGVPAFSEGDVIDSAPVSRETKNAWWCPLCDHSTYKHAHTGENADVCGGCGAILDGGVAKRIARH